MRRHQRCRPDGHSNALQGCGRSLNNRDPIVTAGVNQTLKVADMAAHPRQQENTRAAGADLGLKII